jgi:protein ImuA
LDAALGGGFTTAAVHELIAAQEGVAAHSVALRTAAHAAGRTKWIFYIDSGQDLYPPGAAQVGVPLGRLVVVRAWHPVDALWVCEQTLRCPAVAAVVLPLRTIDAYTSRRLQLAAEAGGGLGLLIREDAGSGHTFAASRLRFDPLPGPAGVRRMLVTVLKLREGRPCEPLVVEWPDAANSMPAHAVSADRAGPTRCLAGG